ncbi:pre-mRNA-splicing factor CWC25 homolog isoform X2 [Phymastichus coffea]|uniref:pre-mRNA-splicing factor CWC25 homolog isoform X2 n=1 Tax=Phymastichus coffea TaxID=108790 RepID=UPI00273B7F4A|nr:pre-mRNA-splicing factor CWC25 homolog isoform X2 [Phymastichus coffea]
MGGGDLNLKKSWHPSTMKNMERVWKAEQQDNEEKKRIAELKKEIAMEKDKEELQSLAMEKKDNHKLDWMYKEHNTVDREQYLLGRSVDKQFEDMAQAEKAAEQNKIGKNHVEHECIPPSIRNFQGDEQVDLARKLQEDPLYAIKKKETESRAQLLKNPVKLKQLRQLLEQEKREAKESKMSKKRKSSDQDLDHLLAAKFKKLKHKISEEDLIKSIKKHKKQKKQKKKINKNSSDDSNSSSESDEPRKKISKKHERKSRHCDLNNESNEPRTKSFNKYESKLHNHNSSSESDDHRKHKERWYEKIDTKRHSDEYKSGGMKFSLNRDSLPCINNKTQVKEINKKQKWIPPKRTKLSETEKERRRQEMLSNASERDKQRKINVKKYEEEERKEAVNQEKTSG